MLVRVVVFVCSFLLSARCLAEAQHVVVHAPAARLRCIEPDKLRTELSAHDAQVSLVSTGEQAGSLLRVQAFVGDQLAGERMLAPSPGECGSLTEATALLARSLLENTAPHALAAPAASALPPATGEQPGSRNELRTQVPVDPTHMLLVARARADGGLLGGHSLGGAIGVSWAKAGWLLNVDVIGLFGNDQQRTALPQPLWGSLVRVTLCSALPANTATQLRLCVGGGAGGVGRRPLDSRSDLAPVVDLALTAGVWSRALHPWIFGIEAGVDLLPLPARLPATDGAAAVASHRAFAQLELAIGRAFFLRMPAPRRHCSSVTIGQDREPAC